MLLNEFSFNLFWGLFLFVAGTIVGSFLNVVAWRVPREESIVRPPSRCPSCEHPVPIIGLIPILGYFLIGRRCVSCKVSISPVYPIIEFLVGAATVGVLFHFTSPAEIFYGWNGGTLPGASPFGQFYFQNIPQMSIAYWLLFTGIPLSLIDLKFRILPDVITLPGTLVSFALGSMNPAIGWQSSLAGIVLGAGGLWAVAKGYEILRKREGLGFGDVKYLALIGGAVGGLGVIWVLTIASILGLFVGIFLILLRRGSLATAIPFGPFLAMAALIECMYGNLLRDFLYPVQ